jgi:hypothetical protein
MRLFCILLAGFLTAVAGCHPGPVIDTGPDQPGVGGTIAGIVSTEAKAPLADRKISAINTQTGARFDVTTGPNGGYTVKVPPGQYRLELELQPGESVAKQPGETRINKGDLDAHRHFVVAGAKKGG